MELVNKFIEVSDRISKVKIVRAIRNGLVSMIPVLIIGAFALVLKSFPVQGYQDFITTALDGAFYSFFDFIYTATFGVLSVYMTFCIARAYVRIKSDAMTVQAGAILSSLLAFFMLSGSFLETFSLDRMGPKSMLIALISGLGATALYLFFFRLFSKRNKHIFSYGADHDFNRMLSTIFPILIVALIFAALNLFIVKVFNVDSFRDLYIKGLNAMFSVGENGFFKGFCFVLLSSLLWFFGIHGSDALEGVMQTYFPPVANANGTGAILTKEFFDCFVLMGGCGATICLLIAILAFSKNRARRGLGITAAPSMIFNINELMVFGLPIIFNPAMLIPFLLVPLVFYSLSYLALATGIVPLISGSVEWTTPILLGGYLATNSWAGLLLQLVLVLIGVAIYLPFVKILDKQSDKTIQNDYEYFMAYYLRNESRLQNVKVTELTNAYGSLVKELSADIRHDLLKNMHMFYQPQYNYEDKAVGVEALLRWKHPVLGNLYPPLVIKLVSECGLINKLEEAIIQKVLSDRDALLKKYGENIHISINLTGSSFASEHMLDLLKEINETNPFKDKNIVIELTEQETFSFDESTKKIMKEYKDMGIMLAIDDFSMGQTSLHYLKENIFDIIKIDGSLVKGLSTSKNCQEIVSSLVELADSLSLIVIAEYVETNEEKEMLHKMGCDVYQGYLYSEPVELTKE